MATRKLVVAGCLVDLGFSLSAPVCVSLLEPRRPAFRGRCFSLLPFYLLAVVFAFVFLYAVSERVFCLVRGGQAYVKLKVLNFAVFAACCETVVAAPPCIVKKSIIMIV